MGNNGEESQGHPAWQELLSEVPEDLHPILKPKLEEWDKRTQGLVQGVHSQYDPYKKFVENKVDPQVLEQSLYMANALQNDPEAFVKRVIENYGIDSFNQQQGELGEEEMDEWDGDDITKHPQFLALQQQLEGINSTLTAQQQKELEAQQEREHDEFMAGLKDKYADKGEFDELYVSTLMANNVEPDKAVEMYYDMVTNAVAAATGQQQSQQQQVQQPPVVMGGSGNAGSGTPDQPVKMGDLSNGDVQDLVIEMLRKQQESQTQ